MRNQFEQVEDCDEVAKIDYSSRPIPAGVTATRTPNTLTGTEFWLIGIAIIGNATR